VKSSLAVEDFPPLSDTSGGRRPDRLRLLDIEQMAMTLAFLAGYQPPAFGGVPGGPEPYCTACGRAVGIFLGYGMDWQHFDAVAASDGRVEIDDVDHAPSVGWRYPAPAVSVAVTAR
jgi:hypothetical protein